jgi:hypothetical protein
VMTARSCDRRSSCSEVVDHDIGAGRRDKCMRHKETMDWGMGYGAEGLLVLAFMLVRR